MGSKRREDGLPRKFVFFMKKKKHKKMRNVSIDETIIEKKYNDAKYII
jgi:hypothetical protein